METEPHAILMEALALARHIRDTKGHGWWANTLTFLRIGSALRLHGSKAEALEALRDCEAHNAHLNRTGGGDEIRIDICRLLVLLGELDEARKLAGTVTYRSSDLVALYTIALTALEMGDRTAAEAAVRDALAIAKARTEEPKQNDDIWLRGHARLALRLDRTDLARELTACNGRDLWKSASHGDVAEALARSGESEKAIAEAVGCPDEYTAVLACARVGAALARKGLTSETADALDALMACASKVSDRTARSVALRIAVGKLAAGGADSEAAQVAREIPDLSWAVLARCDLLSPKTFDQLTDAISRCPEEDRSMLAEALTVSCGIRKMRAPVLFASEMVREGWPRIRALEGAAIRLAESGEEADAAILLNRATGEIATIGDPGWRSFAHLQQALRFSRIGREAEADRHLESSRSELGKIQDHGVVKGLLPQLVEAALASGRSAFAREAILDALRPGIDDEELRDRLLPMLVRAGDVDAALDACSREPISGYFAGRFMAHTLAACGHLSRALAYASSLEPGDCVTALTEIAVTQLHKRPAARREHRVVGVTQHGSWASWFPRLERLGYEWELMSFLEPFEIGSDGLRDAYTLLCYPGTGDHMHHTSIAGAESLREYVYGGGGIFGICAGQFLITKAHLLPTSEVYHPRGQGPHQVQIVKGHPLSFGLPPVVTIPRMNGGFLAPVPGCDAVGWYDKVERYAALAAANFGLGRSVAFGPHPEGSRDFVPRDRLCVNAMNWTVRGTP
jgi:hypothetical protein